MADSWVQRRDDVVDSPGGLGANTLYYPGGSGECWQQGRKGLNETGYGQWMGQGIKMSYLRDEHVARDWTLRKGVRLSVG